MGFAPMEGGIAAGWGLYVGPWTALSVEVILSAWVTPHREASHAVDGICCGRCLRHDASARSASLGGDGPCLGRERMWTKVNG